MYSVVVILWSEAIALRRKAVIFLPMEVNWGRERVAVPNPFETVLLNMTFGLMEHPSSAAVLYPASKCGTEGMGG